MSGATASQSESVGISVIIANYNGRDLLAGCLESIFRDPPSRSIEVIVVDDASSDHSAEMVEQRFPQVRLLRNERNVHYGRSNNRAIDLSRGRFIYLLNNDTIVHPGALDEMSDFLDRHPAVGAVGSKLLNEDGSVQCSVKSLPSIGSGVFGARSVITKLFPHNRFARRHLLHLKPDISKPFPAGYVSSASIMIRREVVQQVGHLDERLSYHIDADYCKRIWDAGWEVHYLPRAAVLHFDHQGGTMVTRRRRFKSLVEFHRGSYIYFRKHLMKSFWHPMHLVAAAGLGARFAISLALQISKELSGRGAKRAPRSPSLSKDARQAVDHRMPGIPPHPRRQVTNRENR